MQDDAIHADGGATITIQQMQDEVLNLQMSDGFVVVKKLGQGGFGTVWLCQRTSEAPRVRCSVLHVRPATPHNVGAKCYSSSCVEAVVEPARNTVCDYHPFCLRNSDCWTMLYGTTCPHILYQWRHSMCSEQALIRSLELLTPLEKHNRQVHAKEYHREATWQAMHKMSIVSHIASSETPLGTCNNRLTPCCQSWGF